MRHWLLHAIWVVGVLAWAPLAADAGAFEPRVGQRHRDFTLPRIDDGTPVSLSQFRGRKVLLIQFASW